MKVGVAAALWLSFALNPASAEPAELRAGGTGAATDLLRQLAAEFGKETGYRTQVVASAAAHDVMAGAFVSPVRAP